MAHPSARARFGSFVLGLAATLPALAASYDESVQGDLPDDRLAPAVLTLTPGSNIVRGTLGFSAVPDVPDLDYITITVPAGATLTTLTLVQADVGGAVSFIAIGQGQTIAIPWDEALPQALLGWHHYAGPEQGQNILPAIGAGPGATGFIPPLPAGTYAVWLMELDGARRYDYAFDFVLAAPAPCPGDADSNGVVNFSDITFVLAAFGAPYTFSDVTTILANFGSSC